MTANETTAVIAGPCPTCTEGDLWAVPGQPVPDACDDCLAASRETTATTKERTA